MDQSLRLLQEPLKRVGETRVLMTKASIRMHTARENPIWEIICIDEDINARKHTVRMDAVTTMTGWTLRSMSAVAALLS